MVISVALTTIAMLIIFKLCLLKRSQHTQDLQVTQVSPPNPITAEDVNLQNNPAYQTMEKDYSHRDKDDYYY